MHASLVGVFFVSGGIKAIQMFVSRAELNLKSKTLGVHVAGPCPIFTLLGQSLKLQDYSRFQQLFDSSIIVDQPSQDQPGPARSVFRAACIALISGVLRLG